MTGQKALRETCEKLWMTGLVSTKTMMDMQGFSMSKERERREIEASDGTDEILAPRQTQATAQQNQQNQEDGNNEDGKKPVGRPKMDNDERNSDPENAIRSKQAKDAADGDFEDGA